jgi:hypothetical protein
MGEQQTTSATHRVALGFRHHREDVVDVVKDSTNTNSAENQLERLSNSRWARCRRAVDRSVRRIVCRRGYARTFDELRVTVRAAHR